MVVYLFYTVIIFQMQLYACCLDDNILHLIDVKAKIWNIC
jgi:hypothetical protein